MDSGFDIRFADGVFVAKKHSASDEVRRGLVLTLACVVITVGALLLLDRLGIPVTPWVEFPGLQDAGLS